VTAITIFQFAIPRTLQIASQLDEAEFDFSDRSRLGGGRNSLFGSHFAESAAVGIALAFLWVLVGAGDVLQ
jgi:hypothetical protein